MNAMNIARPNRLLVVLVFIASLTQPLASYAFQTDTRSLIVATASGQVQGISRHAGGAEFLGIPFAQPPIGNLRWHEPVPVTPWTGIRNATTFGAPCAQPDLGDWNRRDAATGKEDCLFLNVIVPAWPVVKPLPVMFWIHGGANEGGTASSALYKDGTLVNHGVLSRYRQLSPRHLRIPRPSRAHRRNRRITPPATTASWTKSSRFAGSTTTSPVRRRRQQHHRLRPVRRRHGHQHADGLTSREGPVP